MFTKKTRVISMLVTVCMLISLMAVFCLPAAADQEYLSYPSVSTISSAVSEGNYLITDEEDWEYLETNISYFQNRNVTIHLGANIDLSQIEFVTFKNPAFSFDGHGYTVSNWGKGSPVASRGMFFVDDANGMGYIKNLNLYDCHATGNATCAALLYGVSHGNAGTIGLPTTLTMDRISFENCSYSASSGEAVGLLLSRYTPRDADGVAYISNITVLTSEVSAANNHTALLIGKPRADYTTDDAEGATPTTMTYNISNCYLYGNTVNAMNDNNALVVGTAENDSGRTIVNMANIALIDNIIDVTNDSKNPNQQPLIGDVQASVISMKGIVCNNNTVWKGDEEVTDNIYMVINGSNAENTFEDLYCDTPMKGVASMNGDAVLTGKTVDAAAAHALNAAATEGSIYYWTMLEGYLVNTEDGVASSMRKIELKLLATGRVVETIYAEGGSEVELSFDADPTATFSTTNEAAAIDGNVLTVPTDGTDVVVGITLGEGGEVLLAKDDLQAICDSFDGKNLSYYAEGLAEKLAEAEALIADDAAEVTAIYEMQDVLKNWAYASVPNLPSVSEIETYPGAAGYMIMDADDLIAAKGMEGDFTADQTLYLGADIDLAGKSFAGFGSLARFKFDGMNKTIKNWTAGVTTSPVAFFLSSNVASIKNVTFDNINLTGSSRTAIVYGAHANDSVISDRLVIENVHVKNSTINSSTEQAAIFVTGVQNTRTGGYEMVNCSIKDSKIDGSAKTGNGNNYSGFIGRFTNSWPATSTIVIRNCYADNFDIVGGGNDVSVFCGKVMGALGAADAKQIQIFNCVASNCDLAAAGDIGLITARASSSAPQICEVIVNNCTTATTAADTTFIMKGDLKQTAYAGMIYGNIDNIPIRNLYMSNEWATQAWYFNSHTPAVDNEPSYVEKASFYTADTLASGEIAYKLNAWSDEYAYGGYWAMDNNTIVPSAKDVSTVKVEAQSSSGTVLKTYYANSNGTVTLDVEDAVSYAVEPEFGTVNGVVLNLASNGEDVVVVATLQGLAQKELYLDQIGSLVPYFEGFTAGELTTELAALVADAKEMNTETETADLEAAALALQAAFDAGAYAPVTSTVDTYPDALGYSVWTKADLEYLSANHAKFNRDGVVIYIADDIDMSGTTTFEDMKDSKISIDGLGNEIYDWNYVDNYAIFRDNYQGKFVKNLTFRNVQMAGGYGRAILFTEYKGGDVLIENVDMINVTLDSNIAKADEFYNQMGLYIARTADDSKTGTITIKDCVVKNSDLTNTSNQTVNNCGIIAGCIKGKYDFVVENVDLIDCENHTETGAGGLAIGSLETSGTVTVTDLGIFGGKITTATTAAYAGIVCGVANDKPTITFTNVVAMGVESTATQTWMNRDGGGKCESHNATLINCASDFGGLVKAINNSTGEENAEKVLPELTGVTKTSDLYEAAYITGRYVSEAGYPSTTKGEGYGETFKIEMVDLYSGTPVVVDTFYTLSDGTLPAAAADILADDLYSWKYNEAPVDAATVFAADATVTSLATHNFNGTVAPDTATTHKVYCSDDECDAFQIVDCTGADYNQGFESNTYTHTAVCVCGNELETENCKFDYSHVEGTNTHKGVCETCERELPAVACVFQSQGTIEEGDEATTTQPGKKTYNCTAECGNKKVEILSQLAQATVKVITDETAILGEDFVAELVLSGNAAPGVSGLVAIVTYDANAMTIGDVATDVVLNGFTGATVSHEVVEGEGILKIAVAADEPITAEMAFATITFTATSEEANGGLKTIDVEVKDATLVATGYEDASSVKLEMEAEGATINVTGCIWGDANGNEIVSIADVVVVLRVISGALNETQIDALAADVDGVAGITTADAALILRYLIGEYTPNA